MRLARRLRYRCGKPLVCYICWKRQCNNTKCRKCGSKHAPVSKAFEAYKKRNNFSDGLKT